jgi:hypothetical protein
VKTDFEPDLFIKTTNGNRVITVEMKQQAVREMLEAAPRQSVHEAYNELLEAEEFLQLHLESLRKKKTKTLAPPMLAEFIVSFFAPKNLAQSFLGDLQEMYQKNAERFGEAHARREYWMQVASSLGPLLWQWLKRVGFFTILIDYFPSKLGL